MAIIIIPARESSTRLKNKLLLEVCGKTVIQWTVENCLKVKDIEKVIVATDSEKIKNILKDVDVEVIMTPSNLNSGSDRIAYVAKNIKNEHIINVQGDEPLLEPADIEKVANSLNDAPVSSLYYPIMEEEDFLNPNIVKVVMDEDEYALYFSRSPIPYPREDNFYSLKEKGLVNKHIGVYGYKRDILLEFAYKLAPSPLEQVEKLEQLRLLHNGIKIKMNKASKDTIGIDTKEDFEKFCKIINT